MVTTLAFRRMQLITKDEMEDYCKGEKIAKASVNDYLESFFDDIRLGKEPNENDSSYFLSKVTEEELDLVERKDPTYMKDFYFFDADAEDVDKNADFVLAIMPQFDDVEENSEKFVHGDCSRYTFALSQNESGTFTLLQKDSGNFTLSKKDYNHSTVCSLL